MDVTGVELHQLTEVCLQLKAVDVMEIFSLPRFTTRALNYGLKRGIAVDLSTFKPDGTAWDLTKKEDERMLEKIQREEEP
eukprot:5039795-Karenia_brevis.AAC.1